MTKILSGALAAIAMTLLGQMPAANAQQSTQIGTLTCSLQPTIGLIIGSRQRMNCRFVQARTERYSGVITRLGIDLGFTGGGTMVWGVFSPARGPKSGALAGTYVGASGDVAFGLGVGANALVGGFGRSIALQPLSVSGQVGVNLALGVAGLTLRYVR
jgi:Protein of unknown function (DUF992)